MKGRVRLLKWMPNRGNQVPSSTTDLDTGDFLCVCAICAYIQVDPEFKFGSSNIDNDLRDTDEVLLKDDHSQHISQCIMESD